MRPYSTQTQAMPKARSGDRLIEQTIGDETMLYDEDEHKAYLLNPVAAAVWHACDGTRRVEQIATAATRALGRPVTKDLVVFALAELCRDRLLQPDEALETLPRIERREMLLRLGTAAALLIPVIAVVATPAAAQAYSGGVNI